MEEVLRELKLDWNCEMSENLRQKPLLYIVHQPMICDLPSGTYVRYISSLLRF
jgi:hypothetical protein